jgi:hypothetical protein
MISFELLSTNCATAVHLFVCCINKRQNQKVMQNGKEKNMRKFQPGDHFFVHVENCSDGSSKNDKQNMQENPK